MSPSKKQLTRRQKPRDLSPERVRRALRKTLAALQKAQSVTAAERAVAEADRTRLALLAALEPERFLGPMRQIDDTLRAAARREELLMLQIDAVASTLSKIDGSSSSIDPDWAAMQVGRRLSAVGVHLHGASD